MVTAGQVDAGVKFAGAGGVDAERAAVWRALESVPDPEIPEISVVDLGVVRGVEKAGGGWRVALTPTYSGCPAYEVMEREVAAAVERAGLGPAAVVRVLHPPWTTDWLSAKGRAALRRAGIAPPGPAAGGAGAVAGAGGEFVVTLAAACPRCGSRNTEVVAPFGATACKALLRCRACREPFEHFKAA